MNDSYSQAKKQSDKFRDAAQGLNADDDESRWKHRLSQIAKQKPSPDGEKTEKDDDPNG